MYVLNLPFIRWTKDPAVFWPNKKINLEQKNGKNPFFCSFKKKEYQMNGPLIRTNNLRNFIVDSRNYIGKKIVEIVKKIISIIKQIFNTITLAMGHLDFDSYELSGQLLIQEKDLKFLSKMIEQQNLEIQTNKEKYEKILTYLEDINLIKEDIGMLKKEFKIIKDKIDIL